MAAAPETSQEVIDNFWKASLGIASTITKPPSVLPSNVYTQMVGDGIAKGPVNGRGVMESYAEAVRECETRVAQIVAECRRTNTKYSDPHFNLDDMDYCLLPLSPRPDPAATPVVEQDIQFDVTQRATTTGSPILWGNVQPVQPEKETATSSTPACARRVGWIFDHPQFYVGKGAHVKDMRQGAEGDCWFVSSLGSLCVDTEVPYLVEKICPAKCRDEMIGVYGFLFFRDGEWISEVIDDKLYLKAPDYDDCDDERRAVWDAAHYRLQPELSRKLWRKTFQSNSDALFYASCAHPQETWVPLIEKAFAKAHGDYKAIDGGWPGEGVEDLTGGITTEITSGDILDKDLLWRECFLNVNKKFILGAGTRDYGHPDPDQKGRQGIEDGHAYSVLRAVEYQDNRLLMVKNPWGQTEWNGPWSDGSKEWTAGAIKELGYAFGNDGIFWMPYEDFLERFEQFWRTRLFEPEWNVSQHWTTIQVPWFGDYNDQKFQFVLSEPTPTVIVLSQLDNRYFAGLTGQYSFELGFRLHTAGESAYIVRGYSSGDRSAVAEVDLQPGTYEVLMQVWGYHDSTVPKIDQVVKKSWLSQRQKFLRIGLSYDLANAKGQTNNLEQNKGEGATKVAELAVNGVASHSTETLRPTCDIHPFGEAYDGDLAAQTDSDEKYVTVTSSDADHSGVVRWDAPLVVGLRVFSYNTTASIEVARTNSKVVTVNTDGKLGEDDPQKDPVETMGATV